MDTAAGATDENAFIVLTLLFFTVMLSVPPVEPATVKLVVIPAAVVVPSPMFNVLLPALKVTAAAVLVAFTPMVTVVMPVSIPTAVKAPVTASVTVKDSIPEMVRVVGVV